MSNNYIIFLFSLLILLLLLVILYNAYNTRCKVAEGFEDGANTPHPATFNSVYKPLEETDASGGVAKSDPYGNQTWNRVEGGDSSAPVENSCFPRDSLTSKDLLPAEVSDSKWGMMNPSTPGSITDGNYLQAGYHTGINTTGSSLRNPSLDIRSTIPIEKKPVSPWMNSTIEPDLNKKELEIGSSHYWKE